MSEGFGIFERLSMSIFDLKIIAHPLLDGMKMPRFQLSPEFAAGCSPKLRDETNAWLREFFGEDDVAFIVPHGGLMAGLGQKGDIDGRLRNTRLRLFTRTARR